MSGDQVSGDRVSGDRVSGDRVSGDRVSGDRVSGDRVALTRFRNVDFDPGEPLDRWPAEAIETLVERGTLSDWRRLAEAIREEPWGPVARTVEGIVAWDEHYGVDRLMARVIDRARAELDARARARYAARLRQARAAAGLSLRELARRAGTSASRLSDYENAKVAPTTDVLGRIEAVADRHAARRRERG